MDIKNAIKNDNSSSANLAFWVFSAIWTAAVFALFIFFWGFQATLASTPGVLLMGFASSFISFEIFEKITEKRKKDNK